MAHDPTTKKKEMAWILTFRTNKTKINLTNTLSTRDATSGKSLVAINITYLIKLRETMKSIYHIYKSNLLGYLRKRNQH